MKAAAPTSYASQIRGVLDDAGNSRTVSVSLDLEAHGDEVIDALRRLTQKASPVSQYRLRIASSVAHGDAAAVLLDSLGSSSPATRRAAAEASGLLRFDAAIPALGALLADPERHVRRAAAEALGRIGGQRAADHLLRALRSRSLAVTWLLLGLVRAAPDHYLETRLGAKPDPRVLPWLTLAAGIQRRRSVRPQLLELCASTDHRIRANACRALGWIGEPADVPALRPLMHGEQDRRVREAAARALRHFHEPAATAFLQSIAPATRQRVSRRTAPQWTAPLPSPAAVNGASSSTFVPVVPEFRPQPQPAPQPAPQLILVPARPDPAPAQPVAPARHAAAAPTPRTPSARRVSIGTVLAAVIHAMFRSRPRQARPELPRLTPLEVAATPHHYTPSPSLLDAGERFPEGA
jgi:HEAT repeat protein